MKATKSKKISRFLRRIYRLSAFSVKNAESCGLLWDRQMRALVFSRPERPGKKQERAEKTGGLTHGLFDIPDQHIWIELIVQFPVFLRLFGLFRPKKSLF